MSFQDFGRSSGGGNRSTTSRPSAVPSVKPAAVAPSRPSTTTTSSGVSSSDGGGLLGQISESLLQYQRNVGILEKIVQSLTSRSAKATGGTSSFWGAAAAGNNRAMEEDELDLQYKAQVDVIGQLADKVQRYLAQQKEQPTASAANKTTVIKLERDFQRVQHRATMLQETVTRMRKEQGQKQKQAAAAAASTPAPKEGSPYYQEYQQQVQMQLQQDRLNEEIMREREEEIRKINRGMHQVNEIYRDLAHIVGSQQEHIDSIETKMEDSRANAEAGLAQVEKANDTYGSSQCTIS